MRIDGDSGYLPRCTQRSIVHHQELHSICPSKTRTNHYPRRLVVVVPQTHVRGIIACNILGWHLLSHKEFSMSTRDVAWREPRHCIQSCQQAKQTKSPGQLELTNPNILIALT
jgi:hypothetical protein